MAYTRGAAATYDAWAQLGNPGWDWNGVFPYFKKVNLMFKSPVFHSNMFD